MAITPIQRAYLPLKSIPRYLSIACLAIKNRLAAQDRGIAKGVRAQAPYVLLWVLAEGMLSLMIICSSIAVYRILV